MIKSDKGIQGGNLTYDLLNANKIEITIPMATDANPGFSAVMAWYAQNPETKLKDWPRPDARGSQAQFEFAVADLHQEALRAVSEGNMRMAVAIQKAMAYVEEALCCVIEHKFGVSAVGNLTSTRLADLLGE